MRRFTRWALAVLALLVAGAAVVGCGDLVQAQAVEYAVIHDGTDARLQLTAASATAVTPEQIKALFDGNAILIIFVWGLLCKYLPALRAIPNATIPWVGAIGYILSKLAGVAVANAAGPGVVGVVPDLVSVLLGGFSSAVWARQLYEGFGRSLLEGWLGLKKR